MRSWGGEDGRYSRFLLDVGEEMLKKKDKKEIDLPEGIVCPLELWPNALVLLTQQNCSLKIVSWCLSIKQ